MRVITKNNEIKMIGGGRRITNSLLARMEQSTIKGRAAGAGTGDPENLTVAQVIAILNTREKLAAPRTYYVRTDGSNSNNGLANTATGAFLTVQYAIDVIGDTLDLGIYDVTIQIGNGTYSVAAGFTLKSAVGAGRIILRGDPTTPSNVTLTHSVSYTGVIDVNNVTTTYKITGIRIQSTAASDPSGIWTRGVSYVEFENVEFSTGLNKHLVAELGSILYATGNYSISASCGMHIVADEGGMVRTAGRTVTITNTPAWSTAYCYVYKAQAIVWGQTFSGASTGSRYSAAANGVIDTGGGGATYLPGNAAGATATGGQYV